VGVLPTQWIRSGFSAQENPHSNVATCATLEWGTLAFPNRAVVVKLSLGRAGAWTETTLHDFGAVGDGYNPDSGLTPDLAGNLYRTTYLSVFPSIWGWPTSQELRFFSWRGVGKDRLEVTGRPVLT
jgi:hypothetical protein